MPHITAKLRSGYAELHKERLASSLATCVAERLNCPMFDVSVGIADEIVEVLTHLAVYSGWPTANTALSVIRRVFEEAGI